MALRVVTKLARDLRPGDVPLRLGYVAGHEPNLHYVGDRAVVHHSLVLAVEPGWETPVRFDALAHDQEPPAGSENEGRVQRMRRQAEAANARPNAERQFPTVRVTVHGHEDGRRLDQGSVVVEMRALDPVDVIEGDLAELALPIVPQIESGQ